MAHVCFRGRKRVHTRLSEKDRTQRLTRRNRGRFGWGWYHYPRTVSHVSETLRGQVSERHTLPLLGLGWMCSRRTQKAFGTAMRSCASLFRGVAAPLGCVILSASAEIVACTPCAQSFPCVRGRGGITTLGVLCVLLKRRMTAYKNGSFAVSLCPPIYICESPCRVLPISALIQIACRWISCGHTACP